jgi:hypothetical protein
MQFFGIEGTLPSSLVSSQPTTTNVQMGKRIETAEKAALRDTVALCRVSGRTRSVRALTQLPSRPACGCERTPACESRAANRQVEIRQAANGTSSPLPVVA